MSHCEDSESTLADSGSDLCRVFIWGRIHHHFLYDAYTWNQAEKMDLFFIFFGRFFLAVLPVSDRRDSRLRYII